MDKEEVANEKSSLMKERLDKVKKAIDSYREYKSDLSFTLNSSNSSRVISQEGVEQFTSPRESPIVVKKQSYYEMTESNNSPH